jgi:predicted nucleic acid-binding protein
MSVEPGVIDANVLAYAMNADAEQHAASRALLEAARDPATTLYVTSQILCEFFSIITNNRRYPQACSAADARRIVVALVALPGIHVLPVPAGVVSILMELLERRPVTGGDVFDLQIAATMLANDVRRIYTFNAGDFEVFQEFAVLKP